MIAASLMILIHLSYSALMKPSRHDARFRLLSAQEKTLARRSSGWSRTRPIGHAVDLARHDEIILVQSLNLGA